MSYTSIAFVGSVSDLKHEIGIAFETVSGAVDLADDCVSDASVAVEEFDYAADYDVQDVKHDDIDDAVENIDYMRAKFEDNVEDVSNYVSDVLELLRDARDLLEKANDLIEKADYEAKQAEGYADSAVNEAESIELLVRETLDDSGDDG